MIVPRAFRADERAMVAGRPNDPSYLFFNDFIVLSACRPYGRKAQDAAN